MIRNIASICKQRIHMTIVLNQVRSFRPQQIYCDTGVGPRYAIATFLVPFSPQDSVRKDCQVAEGVNLDYLMP